MPQLAAARIEKRGNILVLLLLLLGILAQWPDELRWGDGLELVAVSSHLGVAHPPGYPLLTLLGRATLFLPGENPYRAMLWISRASVLACALGLYSWLKAVLGLQLSAPGWRCFTAGVVAISFAWGGSLWPALVVVEVYGLNAALLVWVACLLARAPNEGQDIGRRALLLASCLEGLALANHISSLCMLPLLLSSIWRQARATRQLGSATSSAALLLGIPVALYATLLPRAAVEHGIAWGGTRDLRSLLVHLSGGEYGSLKFLMEDLNTPFDLYSWAPFFVKRAGSFVASLGGIFFGAGALGVCAGVLLALAAAAGLRFFLHDPRTRPAAIGIAVAVGLQLGFVVTYNIPDIADYFLGIHVLLLPSLVTGMGVGIAAVRRRFPAARRPGALRFLLVLLVPISIASNLRTAYPPGAAIPSRWRNRLLEALPERASLITAGDADLYTLWYTQLALGERRDLAVYGANFVRFPWFRRSMEPGDPRREAVGFERRPVGTLERHIHDLVSLVIAPLLEHGRVFTTIHHGLELRALSSHYELRPAARLLTEQELDTLRQEQVSFAPPMLWEIRPRR